MPGQGQHRFNGQAPGAPAPSAIPAPKG
jgi:hypothetical protein